MVEIGISMYAGQGWLAKICGISVWGNIWQIKLH